ncbi:hypothetical protein F5148DRAFT_1159011 [Russula earlei]|uniref:Uncharacterized protein n=1 Tax=Russula earlei TaxID=71964 RepID=A0ACC0UNB5_9AGAM|nr:hypothetical protein F5148DRAFT_1159011 [Russula earlei]
MPEGSPDGAYHLPYHSPAVYPEAANFSPVITSQPPLPWIHNIITQRGRVYSQNLDPMTSARPNGIWAPSYSSMDTQWDTSHVCMYTHPGTRDGPLTPVIPINFHHSPYPVGDTAVYPRLDVELQMALPNDRVPVAHKSLIPCQSVHAETTFHNRIPGGRPLSTIPLGDGDSQSKGLVATSPQPSPAHMDFSGTATLQPQSAQVCPRNASPTIAPRPCKGTRPKNPSDADLCPFRKCRKRCGRRQDVERHILLHLPHYIRCTESNCNWTGTRRDALKVHLKKKHGGAPLPEQEIFMIYDAKGLVKRLLNKEITVALAE